LRKART